MRDVFIARLTQAALADPRIMLVTGDLGFSVLDDFAARLPAQFINAGVAEQNMTGLATGLALEGRVVFTYSIANFSTLRCLEQIRNDAAYHEANVKVVAVGGGFSYGQLGFSHHATEDLAILRSLPGMTVVAPGCDWEAEEATAAIIEHPGACYLRLDRSSAGRTDLPGERFALGQARTVREGSDLTIVVTGGLLSEVLSAADQLLTAGIRARVLSMHTVKPIDGRAVIAASVETGGILTVEEHNVDGGLGGAVAEVCLESDAAPLAFHRLGLRGDFDCTVGDQQYLRARHELDAASIARAARILLARVAARDRRYGRDAVRQNDPTNPHRIHDADHDNPDRITPVGPARRLGHTGPATAGAEPLAPAPHGGQPAPGGGAAARARHLE